jgi:hypothetical protein
VTIRKEKQTLTSEEFDRFREVTRRLLAVPKKEIDKQKAEYERKKKLKTKEPVK